MKRGKKADVGEREVTMMGSYLNKHPNEVAEPVCSVQVYLDLVETMGGLVWSMFHSFPLVKKKFLSKISI